MTCSLLPREIMWRHISKTRRAIRFKFCIRNAFMAIMTHAKFHFNWLMLTLIFGIWASESPQAWRMTEKAGPDRVNPIQARLFLPFKDPTRVFSDPLMISGTIKASPMKLCTVIVLLKAYQKTKRNFQKYDIWRHNDIITKNNGKIRISAKQGKLYIIRKEMMRAFRKCNLYWNWVTESKVMAI